MKILQSALALWAAATLNAEEGIRILSADPADNVLLEISTDTPQAVMSSSDLKTWSYVFYYLPGCQNFKAYAPQIRRKQTYYKLAPVYPAFSAVVLVPEIPTLEGKCFQNIGGDFSFSAGGIGTSNLDLSINPENVTYSVLDSRPGMISVRTIAADGKRRDHLILLLKAGTLANSQALAYTAERHGDFISGVWYNFTDSVLPMHFIPYALAPEDPVLPVTWPTAEGMVIEFPEIQEVVALGANGIATITKGGTPATASYDYFATGAGRGTITLSHSNGIRTRVRIDGGHLSATRHIPGSEPYFPDRFTARALSYPQSGE